MQQAAVTMHDEQVATDFIVGNGGPVGWTDRAKLAALIAQVSEDAAREALAKAVALCDGYRESARADWGALDKTDPVRARAAAARCGAADRLGDAIRSLMTQ